MNVGDLVVCKFLIGKPVGLIIKVRHTSPHNPLYDILVQGAIVPFRDSTIEATKCVEAVKESAK